MRIPTTLALLLLLAPAAPAQDLNTALSAVVRISGTRGGTPVRGSGFVIGRDRDKATIVTASHVIEGAQQLEITFAADLTEGFPAGRVLGIDSGNPRGLAVFQVRGNLPPGVTALSFETTARLQRGDEVFVLGFPGMVTSPDTLRMSFSSPDGNLLRLDRPVGEGASGGPVLRNGKVVGVVVDEDGLRTYVVKATVVQDAVLGWNPGLGEQSSTQRIGTTAPSNPAPRTQATCIPDGEEERTQSGIVFVRICPGAFTMGSTENDPHASDNEMPAHRVQLSEFWIARTEVTNAQYRRFRPDHQGEDELPATNVSWTDAKAACESFGARLPTEAEWEYAARAVSPGAWSFDREERSLSKHAWYQENSGGKPHPVALKMINPWGLHDMHGNVWEWVADWYGTYPAEEQSNPRGPATGELRVLRGGSYYHSSGFLRYAYRYEEKPEFRSADIGFRCARSPHRQLS